MWSVLLPLKRRPKSTEPRPLDQRLLSWSKKDHHCIADSFAGICATGATGSGKSSGPFETISLANLRAGYGGMFTSAKPSDLATYLAWCRAANRLDDVIIFGPGHGKYFNFLDYENEAIGQRCRPDRRYREVPAERLGDPGPGGRERRRWQRQRIFRQCTRGNPAGDDRRAGNGPPARQCSEYIQNDHLGPNKRSEEARDPAWRKDSFCWGTLTEAVRLEKDEQKVQDLDNAAIYWLRMYPKLNDRTRSNITEAQSRGRSICPEPAAFSVNTFSEGTNVTPA